MVRVDGVWLDGVWLGGVAEGVLALSLPFRVICLARPTAAGPRVIEDA